MDENEGSGGGGGFGDGGDPNEQFHRNEAISAVADEGFMVEEEDDYEDLYNDVNVGEGFLQSMRKNDDLGFRNEEAEEEVVEEKKVEPLPQQPKQTPPHPVVGSGESVPGLGRGVGERKFEVDVGPRASVKVEPVEGFQDMGARGNEVGPKGPYGGSVTPVGGGMKVELGQTSSRVGELEEQSANNSVPVQGLGQQPHSTTGFVTAGNVGNVRNDGFPRQGSGNINGGGGVSGFVNGSYTGGGGGSGSGSGGGGGGTILFVGDLHWWTTDAELETELCKYGPVREVKFFDEKASGKSKGYCQVEFYDPGAATACKEGMNGHVFNGRPCVVAYASPFSVKRMGEAQVNRNQQQQAPQSALAQARRGPGDAPGKIGGSNIATGGNYQGGGGNYQGSGGNYQGGGGGNYQGGGGNYQGGGGNFQGGGDNNRGYGRGNWRGNGQGMGNRGPPGAMRNRGGGMGGRGIMGNGGSGFGPGMGAAPPLLHPQTMMGQGFDPAFGGPMGRMGSFGGFPGAPNPPFSGILSSFPPVGGVGLPGVAPHVNPAFFGRGMPMNGMGMMNPTGVEGHNMGMWSDPNMAGWAGDEQGGRAAESSYGEEAMSDHQYGEVSHDRGGWPNAMKEKDRGSERDWSGSSDRRYRDDREPGYEKDPPREKERYRDDREPEYERDPPREKDVGHDYEMAERRHRDDRDIGRDREASRDRGREASRDRGREHSRDRDRERDRERDHHRDERERYADHHRYRDREAEYEDEWEKGRSSRTHSKSRLSREEEHRSRSRDADYGKRRRLTSE